MTASREFPSDSPVDRIFGPVVEPRTYRNLLYLALSYPLGILYLLSMIAGLAISAGTAILLVGFVVLAGTLWIARCFGRLERELTRSLLGATFEPLRPGPPGFRAQLTDRTAWSAVLYLLVRFPLGVLGLVVSILFALSIPIMAAPVLYTVFPMTIGTAPITTSQEALLVSVLGCTLFLVSAHAVNALGSASRRLAMALL
jgi:hypothetical protein